MAALAAVQAPQALERVAAVSPDGEWERDGRRRQVRDETGDLKWVPAPVPKEAESVARQQCQGALMPGAAKQEGASMPGHKPDFNGVYWMAAMARAADGEFQRRVGAVLDALRRKGLAGVRHTPAGPKTVGRTISKFMSDHLKLEMPRAGNNVDVDRCGVECELEEAAEVLLALQAEFERVGPGGGVVRVKNDFTMSRSEAAEKFGYRTVLTNYRMVCEGVTYRDVLRELKGAAIRGECSEWTQLCYVDPLIAWLDDGVGEDPLAGTWYRDGLKRSDGSFPEWLRPHPRVGPGLGAARLDEPVTLVVETQLILPVFLAGRKRSHWAYKFVRSERLWEEGDGGLDPQDWSYDPTAKVGEVSPKKTLGALGNDLSG